MPSDILVKNECTLYMEGYYYDPKHGGCLRKINKTSDGYKIIGAYGDDEPDTGKKWTASVRKTKQTHVFCVDFSGKPHVTHGSYIMRWTPKKRTINWEDGNVWVGMSWITNEKNKKTSKTTVNSKKKPIIIKTRKGGR